MNLINKKSLYSLVLLTLQSVVFAGGDLPTAFTNRDSIVNTRHNLTQRSVAGVSLIANEGLMDIARNDYGEICVYCHTPHGAAINAVAPLWNRALPTTTTYQTYNQLNTSTLTQVVSQPGGSSLACLSCHDGQQAVDAIINMPGSGRYNPSPGFAFLETWPGALGDHRGLNETGCLACHGTAGIGPLFSLATDFKAAAIGTDLRNDHPVGVNYPTVNGGSTDWKAPSGSVSRAGVVTTFFDENANSRMDKGDIRLYGNGVDSRVECASCHDPHGVPSAGPGSTFNPTFLRKTNASSAVCLTCHTK